ncbi:hypothetical protein CIG75_02845 [Tumebacillus algifaecis]|uniref:Nudix hydrolase domain-containing protein n=1 Tax=Tumebacillus algifaecis TaxID=1214604 RepID=A0A223CXJ5_9BACL|nr:NUDIX domain-containing protein [Tumebacillus algifaecis]ASS74021.1 hypothetical protein CIG75_02845 [Tumebacillus algifaecis]
MKTELFQCFDEEMNPTECLPRQVVHREGHWHQAIHCWVVGLEEGSNKPYVLLQKRHPDKDTYPNYYDISAAGHLVAGETVEDGLREVKEELGIEIDPAMLSSLGMVKEVAVIAEDLIDREFCFVYLYEASLPFAAYRLQEEEVIGLYRIDLYEFVELVSAGRAETLGVGIELDGQGNWVEVSRPITFAELVPFSAAYFAFLNEHLLQFATRKKSLPFLD